MTLKYVVSQLWAFFNFYYLFSATDLELIEPLFLCVLCKVFVHVCMHGCTCMCKGGLWVG